MNILSTYEALVVVFLSVVEVKKSTARLRRSFGRSMLGADNSARPVPIKGGRLNGESLRLAHSNFPSRWIHITFPLVLIVLSSILFVSFSSAEYEGKSRMRVSRCLFLTNFPNITQRAIYGGLSSVPARFQRNAWRGDFISRFGERKNKSMVAASVTNTTLQNNVIIKF